MPETKIFTVPDLGEGLTDASLTEWYVTEGDTVALNQALCSLSTAKAEVDIPSPFAGRVSRRHGQPGDTIDVGAPLVELEVGASAPIPAIGLAAPAGADSGPGPILVGYGTSEAPIRRARGVTPEISSAPERDVTRSPDPVGRNPTALAKPPVRALARRLGVDIEALSPGSGRNGIVTRQDVEAARRARNGHPADLDGSPTTQPPPAPTPATSITSSAAAEGVRIIPVLGVRALWKESFSSARIPTSTSPPH
jgi:2-oxoisovalerate dehydrogenase E2 component (dihydrolipoyl transacylase)